MPGAPVGLHVLEVRDSSLVLLWEPPMFDGRTPVNGYYVDIKEASAGEGCWKAVHEKANRTQYIKVLRMNSSFNGTYWTTGSVISFTCFDSRWRGSNLALPASSVCVPKIWPELDCLQLPWAQSWLRHVQVRLINVFFLLLEIRWRPLIWWEIIVCCPSQEPRRFMWTWTTTAWSPWCLSALRWRRARSSSGPRITNPSQTLPASLSSTKAASVCPGHPSFCRFILKP